MCRGFLLSSHSDLACLRAETAIGMESVETLILKVSGKLCQTHLSKQTWLETQTGRKQSMAFTTLELFHLVNQVMGEPRDEWGKTPTE